MKAKATELIGCLENMFAEWKTVREALMFTFVGVFYHFIQSMNICLFQFLSLARQFFCAWLVVACIIAL